jgi:hypothetical protein
MDFFKYRQIDDVILQCELDLRSFYQDDIHLKRFISKYESFRESHDPHNEIFQLKSNILSYKSEQLVPKQYNDKPFLLFVFGNPASHSIQSGMFFSYERDGREHRFWSQILRDSGIADLTADTNIENENVNVWRKDKLINLKYNSLFRIGLSVMFTFPSPSIGIWSGVAGLKKLFGAKAFEMLAKEEAKRVKTLAHKVVKGDGAIITFQKDAWFQLSEDKYSKNYLIRSKNADLIGNIDKIIPLYGLPPTRNSGTCTKILKQFVQGIYMTVCQEYPPCEIKKFVIVCTGTIAPIFCIEKKADKFLLYNYEDEEDFCQRKRFERQLDISDRDMQKFIQICNQVNVWSWKTRYENPNVIDGWSWCIDLEVGDLKIDSSGSNTGPKNLHNFMASVVELFISK